MRFRNVMHIAMPTPIALLQLSVHKLAQHSVAKSIGSKTPTRMIMGSLTTKRCTMDHSHEYRSASELSPSERSLNVQPAGAAGAQRLADPRAGAAVGARLLCGRRWWCVGCLARQQGAEG